MLLKLLSTKAAIVALSGTVIVSGTVATVAVVNHNANKKAEAAQLNEVSENKLPENLIIAEDIKEPVIVTPDPNNIDDTSAAKNYEKQKKEVSEIIDDAEESDAEESDDAEESEIVDDTDKKEVIAKSDTKDNSNVTPEAPAAPAVATPAPEPAPAVHNCATDGHKWETVQVGSIANVKAIPDGTYQYCCDTCGCTTGGHNMLNTCTDEFDENGKPVVIQVPCTGNVIEYPNYDMIPFDEPIYETRCSVCGAVQ